jgi:hypothetical protein
VPAALNVKVDLVCGTGEDIPVYLWSQSSFANPTIGLRNVCPCLSRCRVSGATANIPIHRRRAEKAPTGRSVLFPCCNLTRRMKQACPCNDSLTPSLNVTVRVAPRGCLITLDHS